MKAAASTRRGEKQDLMSENDFESMNNNDQYILTVTQNGYGKRTSAYEYRITNRGGQGIINIETSKRNGSVIGSFPVEDTDHVMMVTDAGRIIRSPVNDIRIASRNTQGVTLFSIDKGENVVSVTALSVNENNDDEESDIDFDKEVNKDSSEKDLEHD